jgi:hypothetical protein
MSGPNSCPNGDTRVMLGHVNEEFACPKHGQKELDVCQSRKGCDMMPLRWYLAERNRLVTGKTR